MSFLKSVGSFVADVGKEAVRDTMRKTERVQEYMDRFDSLSDEQLMKKMKSSSGEAKIACIQLLRNRGYGE